MTENEIFDAMLDEAWDEHEELLAYRAIGTVEEIQSMKDNGAFTGMELAQIAAMQMKLKKYQSIGTIDEFKALEEKNEPKKIRRTYGTWSGDNYFKFPNNAIVYQCIECYSTVRVGENYCCNCGSCIDWSE